MLSNNSDLSPESQKKHGLSWQVSWLFTLPAPSRPQSADSGKDGRTTNVNHSCGDSSGMTPVFPFNLLMLIQQKNLESGVNIHSNLL